MLIYVIPNAAVPNTEYVCDSQATIDARPKDHKTGEYYIPADLCSIGGEPEANALLTTNQQTWLTKQADLFTVDLQTTVEGGIVWTVVDLATQESNTDKEYFVLDFFFVGSIDSISKMVETLPDIMNDNIHGVLSKHILNLDMFVKPIQNFTQVLVRPTVREYENIDLNIINEKYWEWGQNNYNWE